MPVSTQPIHWASCEGPREADRSLEPVGLERLKEALEANEWGGDGELSLDLEDLEEAEGNDEDGTGFGMEAAEMELEMFGMKQAIYDGMSKGEDEHEEVQHEDDVGQDEEVEKLQSMMLRIQAVRGKFVLHALRHQLTSGRYGRRYARSREEEVCCESSQRDYENIINVLQSSAASSA